MKILLVYTSHRKTLQWYYKRACIRLGHEVRTVGPWNEQEGFGTYGREHDLTLPTRTPPRYDYAELGIATWTPDIVWLMDGGEDLRVFNVPRDIPFVHQSVEGAHMDWSCDVTPLRFVNFTHNGHQPPDVEWLPYGFDRDHCRGFGGELLHGRQYDCAQIGSPRPARVWVWNQTSQVKDLNCWFHPNLWGPAHFALYQNARTTFCNHTHDFLCPRVFDAMAMGCIVMSDCQPSLLSLFEDGETVLAYDAVRWQDGESIPNIDWLVETIRRCKRDEAWSRGIAEKAQRLVWEKHSYEHRVQRVLNAVEEAR